MTDPLPRSNLKDRTEHAPGAAGGGGGGHTQPLGDGDGGSDIVLGNNNNNNNNTSDDKDGLSASSYSDDYTSSYDDSDDSDFSETSETSGAVDDTAVAESEMMREEAKQLCFWRSVVLGSMSVATIILIIVVYNFTRRGEFNDFEQEFDDYAAKIMETVPQKLAQAIGQVDVLAISVMSYANQVNVEWPYAAIPEFELKARNTRRLGELEFVSLVPVVPTKERATWERFALAQKDWVEWGEGEVGDLPDNSLEEVGGGNGGTGGSSGGIDTTTDPPASTTPEPGSSTTETASPATDAPETTDSPTAAPVTGPDNAFVPFVNRVLLERKAKDEGKTTNTTTTATTTNSSDHATAEAVQIKFASMEEALEDFWDTYGTTTGTIVNYTSSTTTNPDTSIATQIYRMDGIHKVVEDHPGPFFPMWQSSPVVPSVVNFNLASHATAGIEVLLALDSAQIVLGAVVNTTAQDDPFQVLDAMANVTFEERIAAGPTSFLYFPVVQNLPSTTTTTTTTTTGSVRQSETQVVAVLTSIIRWTDILHGGDLPDTVHGILCVIENDCDQRFSFSVSQQEVIYLGQEYTHDPTFRHLHVTTSVQALLEEYLEQQDNGEGMLTSTPGGTFNANYCPYHLSIYPTTELQDQFITNKPELIAVMVGAAFCITALVFLCYDGHVESRQRLLVSKAVTSHQIVSSLFPEVVRDRLFGTESKGSKGGSVSNDPTRPVENMETDKLRLKNYINTGGATGANGFQSKPIADLFTHCTVLFGDIAGFTAWSSMREPVQVFTLLESLYAAFDKIAAKRRVFKVETIGDCYMAVTGLPDPQADHAILMARFARDILRRTQQLTRKLEYRLGPDTTDLAMRIGLHSGPVTAGVLRGQKSRFQLFGDTVNTASRMESTGTPQQIQCSQATADLIREEGKGSWLVPRVELVKAKGKGEVQTFWITPKTFRESVGDASYFDGEMTETFDAVTTMLDDVDLQMSARRPTVSLSSYRKRIIGWNVELLASLFRKLIAHRGGFVERSSEEEERIEGFLSELAESSCPRDSYSESIEMPKFDPNRVKSALSPDEVVLSPSVEAQLKDYVTTISCSYQDNPFHNFEHASHVAMCANKLLTRITAAEDFDLQHHTAGNVSAGLHNYTFGIMNDPLTHFACVFSAMIHDVDHPGVSNQQLIKEKDEMAAMYDGKSVAEQNSVDVAWDLLMDPIYSELRQCIWCNMDELKRFRKLIVNSVMATDIFDPELVKVRNERWAKAFAPDAGDEVVDLKATIVIEHIIQASDVAHTMQHWHVYQKWNEKLFSEMCLSFEAGRLEKDPGLGWYGGELWFYDNYIIPLAKKLKECGVFGVSSDEFLTYAIDNRTEWESKGKQIVADYISRLAQDLACDSVSTDSSEELPLNDMEDFGGAAEEASVEDGST